MLDVYAAREDPEPGVTGKLVADAVPGGRRCTCAAASDAPKVVAALAKPGDVVLTMGAGDVTRLGPGSSLARDRRAGRRVRPGRARP